MIDDLLSASVELCESKVKVDLRSYGSLTSRAVNLNVNERDWVTAQGDCIEHPPSLQEYMYNSTNPPLEGYLKEINRVWVTCDNVLYLWNYSTGGKCVRVAPDYATVWRVIVY